MTQSDERRAAILDRLADYVLAEGLGASSLRALAKAADTSDRMLLYYFKDKEEIVSAVLAHVAARMVGILSMQAPDQPLPLGVLRDTLAELALADDMWPYMRLWLEIASLSARGDPLYRDIGEQIGRGFLAWGASLLDSPSPDARAADAANLLITIEGMALLKSLGMEDVVRSVL